MKRLSAEICVSEESLAVITVIVGHTDVHHPITILADLQDPSQYLVLVLVNTGALVIWLVVLDTQLSLVAAELDIKLDHLVLVGAVSVPVDLLK
jgi:uncharacterized membrane-anchored protein